MGKRKRYGPPYDEGSWFGQQIKKRVPRNFVPGYNYCGPGTNQPEGTLPTNELDAQCQVHDEAYGNIGNSAYFTANDADVKFLSNTEGISGPTAKVARSVFFFKNKMADVKLIRDKRDVKRRQSFAARYAVGLNTYARRRARAIRARRAIRRKPRRAYYPAKLTKYRMAYKRYRKRRRYSRRKRRRYGSRPLRRRRVVRRRRRPLNYKTMGALVRMRFHRVYQLQSTAGKVTYGWNGSFDAMFLGSNRLQEMRDCVANSGTSADAAQDDQFFLQSAKSIEILANTGNAPIYITAYWCYCRKPVYATSNTVISCWQDAQADDSYIEGATGTAVNLLPETDPRLFLKDNKVFTHFFYIAKMKTFMLPTQGQAIITMKGPRNRLIRTNEWLNYAQDTKQAVERLSRFVMYRVQGSVGEAAASTPTIGAASLNVIQLYSYNIRKVPNGNTERITRTTGLTTLLAVNPQTMTDDIAAALDINA